MRRHHAAAVAALLALAGCSGQAASATGPSGDSTTTTATPTSSAAAASPLSAGDAMVCQSAIGNDGDVYQLLADLESQGSVTGHEKGRLDLLTVGSTLSTFDGQIQSPELAAALRKIEADAPAVNDAILAQRPISPEPLKSHLADAAAICQHGGTFISWYTGT